MENKKKRRRIRKKRRETATDRFHLETKEYEEAESQNLWKSERKFADEFLQAIRSLELPMKLDRLTRYTPNSYYVAVLQQMKRKKIYDLLSDEHKNLADQMKPALLQARICESMLTCESNGEEEDHPDLGANRLKCEFISDGMSKEWGSWNEYWKKMADHFPSYYPPNYWEFQATALFLRLNLKVVRIRAAGNFSVHNYLKHNVFITNYLHESQIQKLDITKTLLIGKKTDIHFQSLLEKNEEKEHTLILKNK